MHLTNSFKMYGKQVLIVDTTIFFDPIVVKPVIDVLVLSKNPRIYITELTYGATIKQVVADGSVPAWKAKLWKHDCDSLRIPFYNVRINGAFVMGF